jgi:sulfur oxidation c-type cytochrome SoxX
MLVVYLVYEPFRRAQASEYIREVSVKRGTELYVQYCVGCHGSAGLGAQGAPGFIGLPLNTEQNQITDPIEGEERTALLTETIVNGRRQMPAWGAENNGPLNSEQVNNLVNMIRFGDWEEVHEAVIEHYGGEPTPTATRSSGETNGKDIFEANCVGCHKLTPDFADGGETGPDLTGIGSLQQTKQVGIEVNEAALTEWISNTQTIKPGTLMPSWKGVLTDDQIKAVVTYLLEQKGS